MADSTTPNYALIEPEVGSSRDTWGSKTNNNWEAVDAIMAALTPIGAVTDFAGATAPDGWLMCDGTVHPISSYPKLAAVLGNTFGGDGSTTFAVPDCRGRVTAGVGQTTDQAGTLNGVSLAQKSGYWQFALTPSQMPAVAITIDAGGDHAHTGYTDVQGLHAHNGSTDGQGNHAHTYSQSTLTTSGGIAVGNPYNVTAPQGTTSTAGFHAHNIATTNDGNHQHNIQTYNSGPHTHTGRIAGGGAAIPLYQPLIAFNKIIFAGPPDFTTLSSPIPGAPALMASPMRGVG